MARALAECGAKVAILDLNYDAAESAAAALRADGSKLKASPPTSWNGPLLR
jgi:hypothetical protein